MWDKSAQRRASGLKSLDKSSVFYAIFLDEETFLQSGGWRLLVPYGSLLLSYTFYSSGPNKCVVPNNHVGWTVQPREINVWS